MIIVLLLLLLVLGLIFFGIFEWGRPEQVATSQPRDALWIDAMRELDDLEPDESLRYWATPKIGTLPKVERLSPNIPPVHRKMMSMSHEERTKYILQARRENEREAKLLQELRLAIGPQTVNTQPRGILTLPTDVSPRGVELVKSMAGEVVAVVHQPAVTYVTLESGRNDGSLYS